MATNTQNPTNVPNTQKPAGSSKTGAVLSIMALLIGAIGSALVNAKYKSATPVVSSSEKVGEAVGSGTMHVLSVLLAVPMLVAAIALAGIAILLTIIKLRKVKATGWFTSAIWILLAVWALKISTAAFQIIKAH